MASENTLAFNFVARDKGASKTFDKLAGKSDSLGSKFAKFGKATAVAFGTAAAGGVAALGVAFVKGAKDAAAFEVLGKKTAAVIKSTGNVANISVGGVQKLAASLESMSGVDEELIINSQNVLATFTKVRNETGKGNDIFNQGAKAALNMSVALGTDLQGAIIQVSKALNDPIRGVTALRRAGVQLTEQQEAQIKKMVESGDVMGAQKVILKELETQFGGAAKAAGDTFTGKIARAQDALADMARDIGAKALPKLGELADWVATTGVPKFQGFIDFVGTKLVPQVAAKFGEIKTKVQEALSGVDLSGVGRNFATQAKGWATSIIGGVKTGLDTGNWRPLGESIGRGIVKAVEGAGKFAGTIAGKIGDFLGRVDWLSLGIKVGKQAIPLLVGIAIGLANVDIFGLMKGLIKHWQEALFAVIVVAFLPAKVVGAVAKALAKIPLVGPLMSWALVHFHQFSRGLVTMVGRALGFLGKAFLDGFRRVFPGVGESFAKSLALLPIRLQLVWLELVAKAGAMMRGLATAIGKGIAGVVAKIGELIARMLKPFANAGGWLLRKGADFVKGLLGGAGGVARTVGSWVKANVIDRAVAPFASAGSWLLRTGGQVISGLRSGIAGAMRGIGGWVKRTVIDPIVGAVKRFFGIRSPSTVFAGIGGNLVQGLMRGMSQTSGGAIARKIFGDMPTALGAIVNKGLVSIASLPAKALRALGTVGGSVGRALGIGLDSSGASPINANAALGRNLAANLYGWRGSQWDALNKLIMGESGWRNTAQNPTSSAYGIFQFLNSTWAAMGYRKTSDPATQIRAGLAYIRQRYGSPANAYGAWLSRSPHWYGQGGLITEKILGVGTRTGRSYGFGERGPEMVTPLDGRRGGGGVTVVVNVGGSVYDVQRFKAEVATAVREGLRTGHIRVA